MPKEPADQLGERTEQAELEAPFLELAMEAGQMGAWDWQIREAKVIWSRQLEAIHGIEPGSFAGTFDAYQQDMHPDDRERVVATIERTVRERRRSYEIEYRIVRPDGAERWLEAHGRLFVDDEGSPVRMLGICRDITERKRIEDQRAFLIDASEILTSDLDRAKVLESLASLAVPRLADWCEIHFVGSDGELVALEIAHKDPAKVELARELERRWPLPPDAPVGWPLAVRTRQSLLQERISPDHIAAAAQSPEHLRVLQQLGLRSSMVVPLVSRSRVLGAITLVTAESRSDYDASHLAFAEELAGRAALAIDNAELFTELSRAGDDVRRALRGREDLLAMVSHDLRGPLSVVTMSAARMIEAHPPGDEGSSRHLEAIVRSAQRMSRLIRDMLDFSAIEAATLRVFAEPQSLSAIAVQAVESARPLAREGSIEIAVDAPPDLPEVACDRERMLQVLDNLLGNAIKFTGEGGAIRVGVRAQPGELVVTVEDTGVGIAPEDLPRIFDRYWHESQRRQHRSDGGHGLGLFISKGLVEAHAGRIWAESTPGRGSVFSFSLPRSGG
jgi:PAS domain S-box-containing protein